MSDKTIGHVAQIMGPVLDIRFPEGHLPALNNAVELDNHGSASWRRWPSRSATTSCAASP